MLTRTYGDDGAEIGDGDAYELEEQLARVYLRGQSTRRLNAAGLAVWRSTPFARAPAERSARAVANIRERLYRAVLARSELAVFARCARLAARLVDAALTLPPGCALPTPPTT